jgi:hypothetical protein
MFIMNVVPPTAIIVLYDILVFAFAWLSAYWLRFNLAVPPEFLAGALSTLAWVVPLQAAVFWGFGLYRGTWRFGSLPDLKRIVLAVGLAAFLIPLVLVLFRISAAVPRSVLILDPLLLVLVIGGSRLAYRAWKEQRPASVLRSGSNPAAVTTETFTLSDDDPFAQFVEKHMDREAYLDAYPDIRAAGMDPVQHWLEHGMAERRTFFPDAAVLHGDLAAQAEGPQWLHFTWWGKPVAIWIYDQVENARFAQFVETHMDREAYLDAYPDIRAAGMDPVRHWLEHGMAERRTFFPDAAVLHGDLAAQAEGPQWLHFTWWGKPVAIWIYDQVENARFAQFVETHMDREAYLDAYPDIRAAGMDPVRHWLEHGMAERRTFFPDAAVLHGDLAAQAEGPQWLHFTWWGKPVAIWIYDQVENARFAQFVETHMDREAYLDAYPDIRAAGMDPVRHWLEHGMAERRTFFPDAAVLHGDLAAQAEGPQWLHFTWWGKPVAIWIYDQVENARFAQFVETHMDREAYLDAYPDIRAAGMDPVKHWLEYGMAEGRFLYPSAAVVLGDIADRFDDAYWERFTWRGRPVAVRKKVPIKPSLIAQIKAQAHHEPAVLAAGDLAIVSLRQLVGPDLLGRSGIDVRSIFAATPEQPDVVVLIPLLRMGDAEKFAADLIGGLGALGHANILVIVTKDTAKAATGWESLPQLAPFRKVRVVFWRDICGLHYQDPHHFARWLRVLRPSRILVINSHLGLEMVGKYGRGLSHIARIYCVYFGFGLHGAASHYAARFPYRTLPFSVVLTDDETMAATLRRQWGALPGPGIAVLPPRLDPADELVFAMRLKARRTRTENASRSLNWVCFSRGDTFDDAATVLTELARMRPRDQFDFFELVKGGLKRMRFDLPNIKGRGVLADVSSADLSGYDGFLVIGLFEGMPGLALQLSQHATPMVLPDVGGLRDTFDATAVFFVRFDQGPLSVVKDFASALDSVASLTSSETVVMAEATSVQVLARHAPDVYLKHLANIFEIPGSHV